MSVSKSLRVVVLAAWLAAAGCTTLRELPRTDYASTPQRKGVRVETRDGLAYDFDYATYDPDSLTGYRQKTDVDGPVSEVAVVRIALDDVTRMRTRQVDWYRTGLIGGGVIAGVAAVGLVKAARDDNNASDGDPNCSRCGLPNAAGR